MEFKEGQAVQVKEGSSFVRFTGRGVLQVKRVSEKGDSVCVGMEGRGSHWVRSEDLQLVDTAESPTR